MRIFVFTHLEFFFYSFRGLSSAVRTDQRKSAATSPLDLVRLDSGFCFPSASY